MENKIVKRDIEKYKMRKKFRMVSEIDRKYLEKTYENMAREGWLVQKVKGMRDTYIPIEPCELEFSVMFMQIASPIEYPDREKEEMYQEFCEDSGWTLAAKNERCFVYYKLPSSKAMPIHTEPKEEYHTILEAMKKGELLSFSILLLVMLFQFILQVSTFRYENLYEGGGLFPLVFPILMIAVICGYMKSLVSWILVNRKNLKEGRALEYHSYERVRRRTIVYSISIILVLLYLIFSLIEISTKIFTVEIVMISLLHLMIPAVVAICIRYKIKKVKSKKSTNILLLIGSFFLVWISLIVITFSILGKSYMKIKEDSLPTDAFVLTHEDFGANIEFQPRYVTTHHTLLVPLSYTYNSYHKNYEGAYYDIEVTYIEARYKWMAELVEKKIIEKARKDMEDDKKYRLTDQFIEEYVYSIDTEERKVDAIYNLSQFHHKVLIAKGNVLYIIQLDKEIENKDIDIMVSKLLETY